MLMELPEHFRYGGRECIEDGILKIPSTLSWRDVICQLTLSLKGKKCWYCKQPLKKDEVTMDHLYPQDLGGPLITNNLAPSCQNCNCSKSNMTEKEFRHWRKATRENKKIIAQKWKEKVEDYKKKTGYFMPREWIRIRKIGTILVPFRQDESYKGKRYNKISSFYRQYGHLPYPIIVDKNNFLLDGFLILMFASNNNIANIPTIKLDNVEVMWNTR